MFSPFRRRVEQRQHSSLSGHRLLIEAPMASSCRELCWQLASAGAALTLVERDNDDLALLCQLLPTPDAQQHQCLTLSAADTTGNSLCEQLLAMPTALCPNTLLTLPGDGDWQLENGRAWYVLKTRGWPLEIRDQVLRLLSAPWVLPETESLLELTLQSDGDFFTALPPPRHTRVRLHGPAMVTGEEDPLLMRLARHQGSHPVSVARQARNVILRLRLARTPSVTKRTWLRSIDRSRRLIGWPRRIVERGAVGLREEKMLLTTRVDKWRLARHQARRTKAGA